MGATPGRYANRIANGTFKLEGKSIDSSANWEGPFTGNMHTLHGGDQAPFANQVWEIEKGPWVDAYGAGVTLSLFSPAGTDGFPGNLTAKVTYRWTLQSTLEIEWCATSDETTVVNLTNHTYFNLGGVDGGRDCLDHTIEINASRITAVDEDSIPDGELSDVTGTCFDFRKQCSIKDRLEEIKSASGPVCGSHTGNGFDHNFCVDGYDGNGIKRFVARAKHHESGRQMEVWSTQPGVQFFTANDEVVEGIFGKGGAKYPCHGGFCLETQHFPDSPNHEHFPPTHLVPGKIYKESCSYRFTAA